MSIKGFSRYSASLTRRGTVAFFSERAMHHVQQDPIVQFEDETADLLVTEPSG